jgi:Uncharacterized conserved protein
MSASENIDEYITGITDWRGELLAQLRDIINQADPNLLEDWKWGVPVWTKNGMVCAISAFKDHVKINFFKGAQLADPSSMINNGLTSKDHRSIDFSKGDKIDVTGLTELIKSAVKLND